MPHKKVQYKDTDTMLIKHENRCLEDMRTKTIIPG